MQPSRRPPRFARTLALALATLASASAQRSADPDHGGADPPAAPELWLVQVDDRAAPERRRAREALGAGVRERVAPAEHARRLDALAAAHRPAIDRIAATVAAHGGRLHTRYRFSACAAFELPPAARVALRAEPTVAALWRVERRGPHIRTTTAAANHAADVVQATHGLGGAGAALGLLDSGVDADCAGSGAPHPYLQVGGNPQASRLLRAYGPSGDAEDRTGHGTAVASIALARNWNPAVPLADDGFARDAGLASYKITRGSGDRYLDTDLLGAIDQVALDRLSLGICVVNLSYSAPPEATHPITRALDALATDLDVLVVTSAGNDGRAPNPTARSSGQINGLVVGAILPDTHLVWPDSSYGPLVGDPDRPWPDLAAVGVGLRGARPNGPQTIDSPRDGTSFAAPAVAGTALLLRGAAPSLSALETKAVLLNSVADLAAVEPLRTAFHRGAGMLRTDLAVRALLHGSVATAALVAPAQSATVPLTAVAGRAYAVTVCWPRLDLASTALDDLDLELRDPSGRIVAVADQPRGAAERLLFDCVESGTHLLEVRVRHRVHATIPFAWSFAENLGGGRQPGVYRIGARSDGCPADAVDPALGAVIPAFTHGGFGNSASALPIADAPGRMLCIVDGATLPRGVVVDQLALRRDEASFGMPSYAVDLAIHLRRTARPPNAPLPDFAANFTDPPAAAVLDRRVDLPGVQGRPVDADQFDLVLPFDVPHALDLPTGTNLAIDFRVRGHTRGAAPFGLAIDAALDARSAIVHAPNDPHAASGFLDPTTPILALGFGARAPRVPRLTVDAAPQRGATFRVAAREAAPGTVAALLHGIDCDDFGGAPLPLSLAPLGAPACALRARPDFALPAVIGPAGIGVVDIAVPTDPVWTGVPFRQQFLLLDAGGAPTLSATAAASLRIGG